MGIRFRYGKKVAFLTMKKAAPGYDHLSVGQRFWSTEFEKRFKYAGPFEVSSIGREGFVPTVDVVPA